MTSDVTSELGRGTFADEDLTQDAFLGGKVQILQPRKGYRAGVDPVLLASAVPAKPGQDVLELGCGGGIASLCLAARVPGLELTGVEVQPAYAELAVRNAELAGNHLKVVTGNVANLPADLKKHSYDHVIANPPYFRRDQRTQSQNAGRETGLSEDVALGTWLETGAKRLKHHGIITLIIAAERVPDLMSSQPADLGSVEVQPIVSRIGRPAKLILYRAKKGGRADFRLHSQVVMHEGAQHREKVKDYNPLIDMVLRDAAPFPWGASAQIDSN